MKKCYRVTKIRSERACLREKLEPKTQESFIGDFETLEEAKKVYDEVQIGSEVDKLLEFIDEEKNIFEELETTY
jgi:hypothetical protein